jgi:DNA-binding transcriptional regulator GbsR (MarR family)
MRDEEAVRHFVERISRFLADWGFPPMAARVLITMTVSEEDAVTAADLAEQLGVSPAAISGAVRFLTQMGMVRRDPVPGSRRDLYRMVSDDWWELTLTKGNLFKVMADMVEEGIAAVGPETRAGQTMTEMHDYFAFLNAELPLLVDKWRAQRGSSDA